MGDIAPKLLKEIQEDFNKRFAENRKIKKIYNKIKDGTATYADASEFAEETGEVLAKAMQTYISSEALPDGKMYYNIAKRILQPTMENNHNLTAETAAKVQELLNRKSNIGIKAIKPKLNQSRIDGMINVVSGAEKYTDVSDMLNEALINFTMAVVDETARVNAEFQADAGMKPKIKRSVSGGCCDWCSARAGTYDYNDVRDTGNDVFRRHQYCRCLIEYFPGGRDIQNTHTKKWSDIEDINQRVKNSQRYVEDMQKAEQQRKAERRIFANEGKAKETFSKRELSGYNNADIMRLPRYEQVIIPKEKFTQYALNPDKNADKAKAFEKALGYTLKDADDLIRQIKENLSNYPAKEKGDKGWGMTYEVVMELKGKNGKRAKVLTAWIEDKDSGEMRMVTAYVDN